MSNTDKTRSALRASLKAEDASIEKRLPAKSRKPAKPAKPAAPVAVATTPATKLAGSPAKRGAKAAKVSKAAKVADPAPVTADKPAPAKAAAGAAGKASAKSAKAAAPAKKAAPVKAAAVAKSKVRTKVKSKAAGGDALRPAMAAAAPAVVIASAPKAPRPAKVEKVVRDSFSMPKTEQATLKHLKMDLARAGRICTKSELLRVGIRLLAAKSAAEAVALVEELPVVPKGKRKK